ncbi:hypothetical protein ACROYT_G013600 [Oculina patagonica]
MLQDVTLKCCVRLVRPLQKSTRSTQHLLKWTCHEETTSWNITPPIGPNTDVSIGVIEYGKITLPCAFETPDAFETFWNVSKTTIPNKKIKKKEKRKRNSCPLSYIEVIANAILSSRHKEASLSEIYSFIEDNYPEFTENRVRWKNTIRHNLSLHDCFQPDEIALHRSGCRWRIHPSFVTEFSRGDFSRRKATQVPPFALDSGFIPHPLPMPALALSCHMCQPTSSTFVPHYGMLQFHRQGMHVPYGQHPYYPWDHYMH